MMLHVFVGRLPQGTTVSSLRAELEDVGVEVSHVELIFNRATGAPRGFAFVDVVIGASAAETATLARMKNATVDGNALDVRIIHESTFARRPR